MYLKVEILRKEYTDLYIEVPDYFNKNQLHSGKYDDQIGKIALETTSSSDWNKYGWEDDIDILNVNIVEQKKAEQFQIGKLDVIDKPMIK